MNRNTVYVIVIALSIATFAATIVVSYGALKAEAVKSNHWCYTINEGEACLPTKHECTIAFETDPNRVGNDGCYHK